MKRCKDQLEVFCQDLYDPMLNNHALTDSLKPYRSINILEMFVPGMKFLTMTSCS